MTTGQKIPQMSGTIGDIQQGIQTIQMTLGQIIQHQTNLEQRLTALETNASSQFTNLVQQEIQEFKNSQQKQQAQIIDLLKEQKQLLQQILTKYGN
ncbi:2053_t:CDS:2 [Paraglomus brasilianum]|uniref:2053_t:CDS:1 n=1 Tax=Paraglomus brasilianum TaxID=144538 RepID=A0A9N9E3V7_9GLOM|nr:2053_t:CDS:2 [Paraglomus brasilianum]